jgi:NAD(P)-dependent dehydrogenase (short-subunit alcohol dehydrogenase family)
MDSGSLSRLSPQRLAARAFTRVFMDAGGGPDEEKLREEVEGKVVLVTGASYGIGEASALKLGEAGARVALVARSRERLEEVAARIEEEGGDPSVHPCDLADVEAVEALASEVLDEQGRVDFIVNNAGKSIRRSIELSYGRFHDFERTIAINYLGPVRLLIGLLPSMRELGAGHVVNVSTLGVRVPPTPRWAAYQASKAAFDVWLRSLAPEMRRDGVTVTSIYLGLVHTRMSAPTPELRNMPGLSPDGAADLVCRAIVDRPREIEPWWVSMAAPALHAVRGPWERLNALYYRLTADTQASEAAAQAATEAAAEPRDDEEAFERARATGPVPGELGSSGAGPPLP